MVLVFFGLVATVGSAYVQYQTWPSAAIWGAFTVGLPACAVLLANNIRDVDTDAAVGKRTLAVRIGASRARQLFVACIVGAFVAVIPIAIVHPWAALTFLALPLAVMPVQIVLTRADPPSLVRALVGTVRLQLLAAILLAAGLLVS